MQESNTLEDDFNLALAPILLPNEGPDEQEGPAQANKGALASDSTLAIPEEWAPFLPALGSDMILSILRFLNLHDLLSVSLVNKAAHFMARTQQLRALKQVLKQSCLWEYLPLIAQDAAEGERKVFFEYVKAVTNVSITAPTHPHFVKLSSCVTYIRSLPNFPTNWSGIPVNDVNELQQLAQGIISAYLKPAPPQSPKTLKQFMNRCSSEFSLLDELLLWRNYHRLDTQLSTLLLFFRVHCVWAYNQRPQNTEKPYDLIGDLINPKRSQLLTGYGLIALERFVPGVFPLLVREAIRLFKQGNKSPTERQRLLNIECLLDRLTEADLLNYIPDDDYQYRGQHPPADIIDMDAYFDRSKTDRKRTLMKEVIEADYTLLMRKMTCAVLFKIERADWHKNPPVNEGQMKSFRIIPLIFQRPLLLSNLGLEGIIKVLHLVGDVYQAISDYPALRSHLSFEIIERWLTPENDNPFLCAKTILLQTELLEKLTNDQILTIAKNLSPNSFADVIDSPAFKERLSREKASSTKSENILLMQLANFPGSLFPSEIAKNPFTASLLTHDEIITILNLHGSYTVDQLIKHDFILDKISNAELLTIVKYSNNIAYYVALHHIKRFNNEHLISFLSRCAHIMIVNEKERIMYEPVFNNLGAEFERRSATLSSSQWLHLASLHPIIAIIIVNNYLIKMNRDDQQYLYFKYEKNDEIATKIRLFWITPPQPSIEPTQVTREPRETAESSHAVSQFVSAEPELQYPRPRLRFHNKKKAETAGYLYGKSFVTTKQSIPWKNIILVTLLALLAAVGLFLVIVSIGAALGVAVAITITQTLFSFLPWSATLTSCLIGYALNIFSGFCAVEIPYNASDTPQDNTVTKKTCSTSRLFCLLDCCPALLYSQLAKEKTTVPEDKSHSRRPIKHSTKPKHDLRPPERYTSDSSKSSCFQ